jgi:N utilization substance protein B
MGIRRKARENALKILYAHEVGGLPVGEAIQRFWEDFEPSPEGREFTEMIVRGTLEHLSELDQRIQGVSTHWKISRMACVDRNLLRMAVYEIFYVDEIPKRVTLNEAIEIAKRYGTEDSWAFINGILDKIASEMD